MPKLGELVTALVVVTACQSAPTPPARDPFVAPVYAGITRCGPAVPIAIEPAREYPRPAREPVPSFVAPRGDVSAPLDSGGLTPEPIDREVKAHAPAIRVCYMRLLAHDPHAGGFKLQAHFTILEAGTVAGIEIRGTEAAMDRCVCDEFQAMRFPRLDARAVVNYPLMFSDGNL